MRVTQDSLQDSQEALEPFNGQVGITASGTRLFGLVSRSLGELALGLGHADRADRYVRQAIDEADTMGLCLRP